MALLNYLPGVSFGFLSMDSVLRILVLAARSCPETTLCIDEQCLLWLLPLALEVSARTCWEVAFFIWGVWVLTFPNSDSVWSGWPPSRNIGKLKRSSFHKVWQRKVIGMLFHDLPGQWFQFWVWFGLKTVAGGPPHPFCAQLIFHKLWQMHHAPGYVFAQLVSFNLPTHTHSLTFVLKHPM